jgi:hypothetical protein
MQARGSRTLWARFDGLDALNAVRRMGKVWHGGFYGRVLSQNSEDYKGPDGLMSLGWASWASKDGPAGAIKILLL